MAAVPPVGEPDLMALRALLRDSGLPDDVGEHRDTLVAIARDGSTVIGGVAVEIHGSHGLLRSLVVDLAYRSTGIGSGLVSAAEAAAGTRSLPALFLLTEDATGFFAGRGFESVQRDQVPEPIRASIEFTSLCPEDAAVMRKRL